MCVAAQFTAHTRPCLLVARRHKIRLVNVFRLLAIFCTAFLLVSCGDDGDDPGFKSGTKGVLKVATTLPANAYLRGSTGDTWKCERGYRRNNDACEVIAVPSNAYMTESDYGSGWTCERGYRAVDGGCSAISVPANGHLTDSYTDSGWKCDRAYREYEGGCVAVAVPLHGYLSSSTYGTGWDCDRGYRAEGASCVALDLPENAYLDYSGNDWDCNPPYRKRVEGCVMENRND